MSMQKLDTREILAEMDKLFEGFFAWLADRYDAASGGFYYAASSAQSAEFQPDIESTAQALNILERSGLLPLIPSTVQAGLIRFFQSRQHAADGYFYDAHPAMKRDEVMVHRALHYAVGALRKLGSAPLYPLPFKANAAPGYVRTPGTYLEKWQSIDLSNSWRGCDRLSASCVYIEDMPEQSRKAFLDQAVRFLERIQDPDTGLWGEGSGYVRISGTFKLHTFYSRFLIPMPRADRIYQSILRVLRNETAADMCYVRNPIHLLSYIREPVSAREQRDILQTTTENMGRFLRGDGGFSREIEGSPPAPNVAQVKKGEFYPEMPEPVALGKGLKEGDMNAGTQAILIRRLCFRMADERIRTLPDSARFYKLLK